jgi:hypothetical protein
MIGFGQGMASAVPLPTSNTRALARRAGQPAQQTTDEISSNESYRISEYTKEAESL